MESQRLHEALTGAGSTESQAAVYLAVLDLGEGPVVNVAERANVPASQVYEDIETQVVRIEGFHTPASDTALAPDPDPAEDD